MEITSAQLGFLVTLPKTKQKTTMFFKSVFAPSVTVATPP